MHDILVKLHELTGLSEEAILHLFATVSIPAVSALAGILWFYWTFIKGDYLDEVVASHQQFVDIDGTETLVMPTIVESTLDKVCRNIFLRRQVRRGAKDITKECPALILKSEKAHRQMMRRFYNLVSPTLPGYVDSRLMMIAAEDAATDWAPEEHKIRPKVISREALARFRDPNFKPALMDENHAIGVDALRFMATTWFDKNGQIDGIPVVVEVFPPWPLT